MPTAPAAKNATNNPNAENTPNAERAERPATDTATDHRRALELLRSTPYGRLASSWQALPMLAAARHIVTDDGQVLLRMHGGFGYHHACDGMVVAYSTDDFNTACGPSWLVQFVGTARLCRPGAAELERFGTAPVDMDGQPFAAVYMRVEPQLVSVHTVRMPAPPA